MRRPNLDDVHHASIFMVQNMAMTYRPPCPTTKRHFCRDRLIHIAVGWLQEHRVRPIAAGGQAKFGSFHIRFEVEGIHMDMKRMSTISFRDYKVQRCRVAEPEVQSIVRKGNSIQLECTGCEPT